MIATIVLPAALAALIAVLTAIAPLTSAISALSAATTEKVVTDIETGIAKHKKKQPRAKAQAGQR
jgi:hypothetical protein